MLEAIVSIFAPHICLACGQEGSVVCPPCIAAVPALPARCYRCRGLAPDNRTCQRCRRASKLYSVQVGTEYAGVAKDLVWRLKFSGAKAAVKPMVRLMTARLVFDDEAVLVPVPTATSRVRQRGYDQAGLLSQELSRRTGLPSLPLLARCGQDRQVGSGRTERVRHLTGAFRVPAGKDVRGKHVILVDDVLTTGATLEAAAATLHKAGAARVDALVFAQA